MPSLLAQLEMDYNLVQQTDAMLHEHLGNWLSHMEQWMHKQQDMFKQIQSQCSYLGLQDPDVLMPSDGERLLPNSSFSSPESGNQKQQPPRLPAAVRMTPGANHFKGDHTEVPPPSDWDPASGASPGRTAPSKAAPAPEALKAEVFNDSALANVSLLEADDWDEPPLAENATFVFSSFDSTQVCSSALKDEVLNLDKVLVTTDSMADQGFRDSLADSEIYRMTMSEVSVGDRLSFQTRNSESTEWDFIADSQVISRSSQDRSSGTDSLPPEFRMWVELVDVLLHSAKKRKFYELREEWIQPDTWVNKVMRNHPGLDLRVLVAERRTQARTSEGTVMDGTGSNSAMRQLGRRSIAAFNQSSRSTSQFGKTKSGSSDTLDSLKRKRGLERYVLDPQSPSRLFWMSIGMLLMLYDLMVLPLNSAFTLPKHVFLDSMQWFSQSFWSIDIGVTFMTGVYLNSELVTDLNIIAKTYATTWLSFDVGVVAPLWFVQIMSMDESRSKAASNAGAFRFIRMVRFLRLARLAKFEHYLQEALAAINSSSLILCVGIFKLMVMMIILSHLNACCWYAVGSAQDGGWVDAYDGTSLFYKYLTSMHWAFTQFQGTSEILPGMGSGKVVGERAYAVVCVMFALIILSFFVSSLTNMMMQLQALRNERVGMARAVREYLNDNAISKGLSIRVKKYIDWKQRMQRKLGGADKVLAMLPVALQIDLQEEVRGPILSPHKFFASLKYRHTRTFRIIVHEALKSISPTPGEMVFSKQDEANKMYFVVSGLSRYMPTRTIPEKPTRDFHEEVRRTMISPEKANKEDKDDKEETVPDTMRDVSTGDYLCEPVLWTFWEHKGVFMGVSDSHYLVLGAKEFCDIAKANQTSHVSSILYARQYIAGLNRFGKTYNDIIDIAALSEDDD